MKKYAKSAIAILLTASMMLPLAACKKGKKTGTKKIVSEDDPYFTVTQTDLQMPLDKDKKVTYSELYNTSIVGDRLIGSYNVQYEFPEDLEDQINKLYENMQEGQEDEIMNQIMEIYSEYSDTGVAIFDLDGNLIKKTKGDGYDQLSGITPLKEGGYLMLMTTYEMEACKETYKLAFYNQEGDLEKEIPLKDIEDAWGANVYPLPNGNFLLASWSALYLVDKDGKLINKESEDGMEGMIYEIDGKYYVYMYSYDEVAEKSNNTLNEIDINTGKISPDGKEARMDLWNVVKGSDGYYLSSNNGLKKIDPLDRKSDGEMLLDWNWTDLNRTNLSMDGMCVKSEDEIYFVSTIWDESEDPSVKYSGTRTVLNKLTREEKNPHAGKTIIQIAAASLYSNKFMDYVVDYNTDKNNKSRIQIKDYSEDMYNTDDYEKAIKEVGDKLYLEMLAGEGADILVNFSSFSQFNNDEVLVDLNKYIDGDKGFNRDDYFDNVFRAFETKGKMYQIPVCVDIHGFIANKDYVGDRDSWTYDEFSAIADSLPEDVTMMEDQTCAALMQTLLSVASSDFIDYEKKSVNFESPDFAALLNLAKKYGVLKLPEPDYGMVEQGGVIIDGMYYEGGMGGDYVDPIDKVKEGMQVMTSIYFYSLQQYAEYEAALGDKAVFLGAPAPSSSGLSAQPMLTLAISATTPSQDEAWDFIRFMFEKEQQISYARDFYSVPLMREALDEKNEMDIKEYMEQKEEMKQWDPEFFEEYYAYDLTEETAAGFVKVVEGVRTINSIDQGIMMIVNEEAPAFFEGQRSVEDVCKNIQNRATTLLHER